MAAPRRVRTPLLTDLFVIGASIFIAVLMVRSGVIVDILAQSEHAGVVGMFVAGVLFTSIFTAAPAVVALGEIALVDSLFLTALVGAAGSVAGDLFMFHFLRDRFAEHLRILMGHRRGMRRFAALLRLRLFRVLSFFMGGLLLASPLPDEVGIGLFAFSKISSRWLSVLSFIFHFFGILLIGAVARDFAGGF